MRIVFDNIVFSLQKRGGISVVWQEILSRFLATGKDKMTFIEHPDDVENTFRQKLDLSSAEVIKTTPRYPALERYANPRVKGVEEPFIFHSSYFRTCSNHKAVNVVTVHDFTYEYFYKGKRRGAFLHIWQRNKAVRKADAVVCISENTKRDLLKFLPEVNPEKVHVIYNAVSEDYHVVEDKYPELCNSLLFVGERDAYKNAKWLVDAIKDTDYKVVFCGGAVTEDEKKYYDRVLGNERYEVRAGLSNHELNRVYNSVKCLVYPSSYEGFGIPVLEAQRAGCPVIALNTSSIPEVIGESPLLMDELTKEELFAKLELLNNDNMRNDIIEDGLKNSQKYSWDRSFKEYRELYRVLLESKQ